MVAANIAGDLIAIFIFKSLLLVAVVSILFTLVGIYTGMHLLNKGAYAAIQGKFSERH